MLGWKDIERDNCMTTPTESTIYGRLFRYLAATGFLLALGYVAYTGGLQRAVFFAMGGMWILAAIGMTCFAVGTIRETGVEPLKVVIYVIFLLGLLSLVFSSIKWAVTDEGIPPYLGGDDSTYLRP
jgi:hypothetical protein